jgi:hypothetical protein
LPVVAPPVRATTGDDPSARTMSGRRLRSGSRPRWSTLSHPRHPRRVHPGGAHDLCRPPAQLDRRSRCIDRSLHHARTARIHPLGQRPEVRRHVRPGLDRRGRREHRLHRAGLTLGERLRRELQCTAQGRTAQRGNLLLSPRGQDRHRAATRRSAN